MWSWCPVCGVGIQYQESAYSMWSCCLECGLGVRIRSWCLVCLFDLILYVPVNNLSITSGGSSWVEPVLS